MFDEEQAPYNADACRAAVISCVNWVESSLGLEDELHFTKYSGARQLIVVRNGMRLGQVHVPFMNMRRFRKDLAAAVKELEIEMFTDCCSSDGVFHLMLRKRSKVTTCG